MATVKIAAVQAAYELMDQKATLSKASGLLEQAAADGAEIVVFPEVFVPGTRNEPGTIPRTTYRNRSSGVTGTGGGTGRNSGTPGPSCWSRASYPGMV